MEVRATDEFCPELEVENTQGALKKQSWRNQLPA